MLVPRTQQTIAIGAEGQDDSRGWEVKKKIVAELGIQAYSHRRWCNRLAEAGLAGIEDGARNGWPMPHVPLRKETE